MYMYDNLVYVWTFCSLRVMDVKATSLTALILIMVQCYGTTSMVHTYMLTHQYTSYIPACTCTYEFCVAVPNGLLYRPFLCSLSANLKG